VALFDDFCLRKKNTLSKEHHGHSIFQREQPFMDIACLPEDVREGINTHQELDPANMLSLVASLTPFSDYNQSPRNM